MIHKKIFLAITLLIFTTFLIAQPANDDCENAIQITDVTDWCSDTGEYTNINATTSGYPQASCFSDANNDVWFSFTAVASDISITIVGAVPIAPGGTLNNPAVALYSGICGGTISELRCEDDAINNNIIELYRGGLTAGETYYIRVNGRSNNTGTFQLCINNYYPPIEPGADCNTAAFLCDTSPFTVQSVVGAGANTDEAAGTCLGESGVESENNSTWFTWTAANNGMLTFTLIPSNPEDDLDFVVYELDGNSCGDKEVLRCMASGQFASSGPPCMGPTGLAVGSTDTQESFNCDIPGDDNFLAPLQMEIATTYALLVNNFSETGNGFSISFGGNGQFVGPNAQFSDDVTGTVCAGESITFTDNSSFSEGNITTREWNFGFGAVPQTATGIGPHTVQFTQPGNISVALQLETDLGCLLSHVVDYEIDACCNSLNEMFTSFTQTDLECADDANGAIDVSVSGGTPPFEFEWSTGDTSEDLNNLIPGNYLVTISDQIGCETIFDINIDGPPLFQYEEEITTPTCGGGTDGAINLTIGGATPPYTFVWTQNGMPFGGNTEDLTDIPIGDYTVVITDNNGCQISHEYEVRELELELSPDANIVSPSCNGASDGTIELDILNGLPPYEFDLNDGNGFTSNSIIQNVAAGTYTVTIRDANMCMGNIDIVITEPDVLEASLDGMDISCFGYGDGMIDAVVTGGTPAYTYTWNPTQTNTANLTDLDAGDYSLTVTDQNGCTATATTTITEPAPVTIESITVTDNVCFGGSAGELTVSASGGSPPFQYSSDGITFQDSPTLTGLPAGTITVTIRDAFGCDFSTEADISQPVELILYAGEDVEIDLSYSTDLDVILTNSTIDTIEWFPPLGLSCTDCLDPTAMPPFTTTYIATATTPEGCMVSDSVTVRVNDVRPVYIPNIFSPNFDGQNDTFTAFGGQAATLIREFRVYDRWGGLVYEATNIDPNNLAVGWDGTVKNGREAAQGVYVYHIRMEFFDGQIFDYQGDVMVVR